VNPMPALRLAVLATGLLVLVHASDAQNATKPPPPVTKAPPRLPPNAAESGRIPAGVDTGSGATTGSLPLGTPVPPVLGADRTEIRNRSAAARAAARPKLGASDAGCAQAAAAPGKSASASAPRSGAAGAAASAPTTLRRAASADC